MWKCRSVEVEKRKSGKVETLPLPVGLWTLPITPALSDEVGGLTGKTACGIGDWGNWGTGELENRGIGKWVYQQSNKRIPQASFWNISSNHKIKNT